MNVHTKEKQYPCEFCTKIFYKMANRSRHIKVFHCGVKNYKCEHCDRSFGKAETLKHHTMTHTDQQIKIELKKISSNYNVPALIARTDKWNTVIIR